MKDFAVLRFLDRFKGIFQRLNIDYDVMRRILQVKLIMDGRRVPTIVGNNREKTKEKEKNNFYKALWMYGLIGLTMIPFVVMGKNYIFQMSFLFGLLMFMVMTSLISDFSSVLLDIRDKNILFSKPVNSRTLSVAKTIHVSIYMFMITLAISGPALIVSLFTQGLVFFIILLLEIILMDLFIVVLTALLYLLILNFFDGEKLKDIINYVQIALSIIMVVGYQFIGRLFQFLDVKVVFNPKWWQYFIIPVWFAAPFEVLLKGSKNINYIIFSILAILIPILSIAIYIALTPYYEKNLQKLGDNSSKQGRTRGKFTYVLSRLVCFNLEERIFFRFSSSVIKNEREFKLKIYPSLGFEMIIPLLFIINYLRDGNLSSIANSRMYLNIYFCALIIPTLVFMMKYSGQYKGSWIYKAIPIEKAAHVIRGTLKAFLIRLVLPIYLLQCIIFIALFGIRIFPDLVLVFLNLLFFTVVCFRTYRKALPFSEPYEATEQGVGLAAIPLLLFLALLAVIHYGCTFVPMGVYSYLVLMLIINIIAWRIGFTISI